MPRILATCLLLALALPGHAQERKPNTLTPKEIADGWILLFDGQTTKGWDVGFSSAKSGPVVRDGALDLGGLGDGYIISPRSYIEFELQVEYKSESGQVYLGFAGPKPGDEVRRTLSHSPGAKKDWTLVKFRMQRGKVLFQLGDSKSSNEWNGPAFITFGGNQGANLKVRNIKLRPLAQDKPKPNTLTPKEIADGWILLFDGETTFGWKSDAGPLKVSQGVLEIGGKKRTIARHAISLFVPAYELDCEFQAYAKGAAREDAAGGLLLEFANGTTISHEQRAKGKGKRADWHKCVLRVDGEKGVLENGNTFDSMGMILVSWFVHADAVLMLRNAKFRPLKTKSLFNGKDLTGWKVFPSKKSQFTVKDSAIHLTNGPGDLQTLGKYKDFILQLECKSNGKHLNSGVFFRCRDNEYQNGYEAQIRNQFTDKPTQKYLIEEFDPKTHKLIGKKAQMFTAVDYGTGAIYRRQPARKAMAKDGEWFTMTIVAHGNHFATWVNGIQVTDWTDNRPRSDNARKGCCLNAGHISIQGHDPTTDLSFRNIRIAELK